jgi:hypothetical protein
VVFAAAAGLSRPLAVSKSNYVSGHGAPATDSRERPIFSDFARVSERGRQREGGGSLYDASARWA